MPYIAPGLFVPEPYKAPKPKVREPSPSTRRSQSRARSAPSTPREPSPSTRRSQSRARSSPSRASGGGGVSYGGGGGGYGGGGSNSFGGVVAPPPAPSLKDYLSEDTAYGQQIAALRKALANYQAQMGERKTEYGADYSNRMKELGLQEEKDLRNQSEDYASRGILRSGVYAKDRGETQGYFDRRESDMSRARDSWLSGLARDYSNFQEEQNLTRQRARQDAIERRAAKYGITV